MVFLFVMNLLILVCIVCKNNGCIYNENIDLIIFIVKLRKDIFIEIDRVVLLKIRNVYVKEFRIYVSNVYRNEK